MQPILEFGVRFIVAFQGLGAWLTQPAQFFTFLGTEDFFILALPILYWCVDSMLGIQVAVLLLVTTNLNAAFKLALHAPRPYWYSPKVRALASETSFGVPSGHAQTAATIWGLLAASLRKWWGWLIAILLTLLIGLSRLYLGVHFPHDVLLGWLIGGLLLWLALRFWNPVLAWAKKLSVSGQVLAAFLASLVIFVLPLIPFI
jgi:membrane-associated phospholipid phosphatase